MKVVQWARSCKDQAIYAEVKAAFSKEVAIELVEKVLKFLTRGQIKTNGVTMANFEFNSHIKVINGSVFKSFLKIDGVKDEDWEDEEKVEALRMGLKEVLQTPLAENFDPTEERVGTVDWSFNVTYKPETFKTEIFELSKDHVCLYILVSPGEGNFARVKQALKMAATACQEENIWWDAVSNKSSTVVGCRTQIPGFAFRLREGFMLVDRVQVMPSSIAALSTINPLESFTPKVTREISLSTQLPTGDTAEDFLSDSDGSNISASPPPRDRADDLQVLLRKVRLSLILTLYPPYSVNQRWYNFIRHLKHW